MKRALSVGINYPGQSAELRGCVNDSFMIKDLLEKNYGFDEVTLLLDNQATTANIRKALNTLVAGAAPGDVLFFHYSGHGSQVFNQRDDVDDNEPDNLDEIICPVDLDWDQKMIRDDELKDIFDRVPNGVNLTVFLDCCNSGGGMDHLNQYQPLAPGERAIVKPTDSGRYLRPPQHIMEQMEEAAATRGVQVSPRALTRKIDHSCMMISGCQSHQTSADAYIDGTYRGAATYYLNKTLEAEGYDPTYKTLIEKMNKGIAAAGFTQRPELNGPERLHDQWFLGDHTNLEFTPDVPAPTPVDDGKDDDGKKDKKKLLLIVAVIAAAAIAYFAL
jgi:hypothetical protein